MTEIGDSFFLQLLVSFPLRSRPLRVSRGPVCPPLLGTLDRSSSDGLAGCELLFVLFFFFFPLLFFSSFIGYFGVCPYRRSLIPPSPSTTAHSLRLQPPYHSLSIFSLFRLEFASLVV